MEIPPLTSSNEDLCIDLSEPSLVTTVNEEICFIDILPNEILIKVFNFLSEEEKVRCELVCKKWFDVFQSFWKDYNRLRFKSFWSSNATILHDDEIVHEFIAKVEHRDSLLKWCIRQGSANFTNVKLENMTFPDSASFVFVIENCSKLNNLELNNVVFEGLSAGKILDMLVSKEKLNSLIIVNCRNESFGEDPYTFRSVQSNVTQLQLKNYSIKNDEFLSLCQNAAPKLEFFCLTQIEMDLESLVEGLRLLNNVKNLNLEACTSYIGPQFELQDETLRELAICLVNVEVLSLSGCHKITSDGVNHLLQSPFGREKLRHLNLDFCLEVDNEIFEGLKDRSSESPNLIISAFETLISDGLVNRWSESCRWKVIIERKSEKGIFFGEVEDAEGTVDDVDDDDVDALGYDSGGGCDHDYDVDDYFDHDLDEDDYDVDDDDDYDDGY